MTGPPWLRVCWLILCPNRFERDSSVTATERERASSVVFRRDLFQEYEMACATSKVPDAAAAISGMSRVFSHLNRGFIYS